MATPFSKHAMRQVRTYVLSGVPWITNVAIVHSFILVAAGPAHPDQPPILHILPLDCTGNASGP